MKTAAAALRELAGSLHGDTGSPRRLLVADGKWWANVRSQPDEPEAPPGSEARCRVPGHERQALKTCRLCAGEVHACPDCPRGARRCEHAHQPAGDIGDGAKWLPDRVRRRRQDGGSEHVEVA